MDSHGLDLSEDDNSKKSRKRTIPRNVATYLKKAMLDGFAEEMAKLSEEKPSLGVKAKHLGQLALFGGLANPALQAVGTFAEHAAAPGGGLAAGAKAVRGLSRAQVGSSALTGAIGGSLVAAAKDKLKQRQESELGAKMADLFSGLGAGGAPSGPKVSTPAAPSLGVLRGSSNKSQRVGNTPIAAKSGVTRPAVAAAMNPRTNLTDAIRPKV